MKTKKKEFLFLNFFKLSNSEKLKNEKSQKYFSPIFTFAATWCQEKKAKKKLPPPSENIHTIEFFLATLNSKIKKNEFSCPKK